MRPLIYTEDKISAMLDAMEAESLSLYVGAQQAGIPFASAWEGLERYPAQRIRYDKLRAILADKRAHLADTALSDGLALVLSPEVDPKRTSAVAALARAQSDRHAWAASKLDPERYGDRVTHQGVIEHKAVVLLPQLAPLAPLASAPAQGDTGALGPAPTVRATLARPDAASDPDAP